MKLDPILNQPLVETDRFDLRPLRKSDMGLIELYASDERVARMTASIPHPLPPGQPKRLLPAPCPHPGQKTSGPWTAQNRTAPI